MTTTAHTIIQLCFCVVGIGGYAILRDSWLAPVLLIASGMPLGLICAAWTEECHARRTPITRA